MVRLGSIVKRAKLVTLLYMGGVRLVRIDLQIFLASGLVRTGSDGLPIVAKSGRRGGLTMPRRVERFGNSDLR